MASVTPQKTLHIIATITLIAAVVAFLVTIASFHTLGGGTTMDYETASENVATPYDGQPWYMTGTMALVTITVTTMVMLAIAIPILSRLPPIRSWRTADDE